MIKTMFLLAAAVISITSLKAQKVAVVTTDKPGWHKIGETTVDFKTDKDKLYVLGNDHFKSIILKAVDAPVHIENLEVVYGDGEPEEIPVRFDFKAGSESRNIDLKGYDRKIKEINLVYRTVPNWKGEKAHIEIWGLK
ncbi:MAG: hypothetical protein JO072_06400 [Parafilimonas sp.]|nr:hypothetical protein [Parafilimonas sp.]